MATQAAGRTRAILIWTGLTALAVVPLLAAAQSPFLQWRDPVYIVAGFAGISGLVILLFQPLLARGLLPGLPVHKSRKVHRWTGAALFLCVASHVVGLYLTSPPDVVDVLLLRSPTPFSLWGLIAMLALTAAALLALFRRRLHWRPGFWRGIHSTLGVTVALGTIAHALLIEGAMEPVTKALLCLAVFASAALLLRPR